MMRAWLVLLLLPVASAMVVDDPAGDVQLSVLDEPISTMPSDRFQATDLRAWSIEETPATVWFNATVTALRPAGEGPMLESAEYAADFAYGDASYRLTIDRNYCGTCLEPFYSAALLRLEEFGRYSVTEQMDVEVDLDTSTVSAPVPRGAILDENGAYPVPGHAFRELQFSARARTAEVPSELARMLTSEGPAGTLAGPTYTLRDIVETETTTYVIKKGGGEVHGLSISADEPYRVSNGEATTLLFETRLVNLEAIPLVVGFSADRTPSGWDIWFPSAGITMEPGAELAIPVLVRMPFSHLHGATEAFTVRASGGDAWGDVELGVRFADPPHPAGHHPTVYLHGRPADLISFLPPRTGEFGIPFMDTLEDGPATRLDTNGRSDDQGLRWDIPLAGGLGMGLVFDLDDTGIGEVTVHPNRPIPAASLGGMLLHVSADGNETPLGNITDLGNAVDLEMDTPHTFSIAFTPSVDRVPFTPRAQLVLRLDLDTADSTTQLVNIWDTYGATLQAGSFLRLPLGEYHDQVKASFAAVQTLAIEATTQERRANPGKVAVFDALITNHGPEALDLELRLSGQHTEWARVVPAHLRIAPGAAHQATIIVEIPSDARDGDVADLILEVDGGAVRALLRLVTSVDTTEEHADMAALAMPPEAKRSPGLGGLLPVAAALWFTRRR